MHHTCPGCSFLPTKTKLLIKLMETICCFLVIEKSFLNHFIFCPLNHISCRLIKSLRRHLGIRGLQHESPSWCLLNSWKQICLGKQNFSYGNVRACFPSLVQNLFLNIFFFFKDSIYLNSLFTLFIFGCTGSSLLRVGFL